MEAQILFIDLYLPVREKATSKTSLQIQLEKSALWIYPAWMLASTNRAGINEFL